MHIELWSSSPLLSGRHEFKFDDTLGAERHGDRAIESLRGRRRQHTSALAQSRQDFRASNDLCDVRRPDFLLTFAYEYKIHRQLATRATNRMHCGKKRSLRSFRIDGATANQDFSETGVVNEGGSERRG